MLDELLVEDLVIVVPNLLPIPHAIVQARQMLQEAVSPALLELRRQDLAPGEVFGGVNVRLVREYARHKAPELPAYLAAIGLHGYLEEFLRHPGREQVHVTAVPKP